MYVERKEGVLWHIKRSLGQKGEGPGSVKDVLRWLCTLKCRRGS